MKHNHTGIVTVLTYFISSWEDMSTPQTGSADLKTKKKLGRRPRKHSDILTVTPA